MWKAAVLIAPRELQMSRCPATLPEAQGLACHSVLNCDILVDDSARVEALSLSKTWSWSCAVACWLLHAVGLLSLRR